MAPNPARGSRSRVEPRQRRSREIVSAILQAGRELLERDGLEALNTNRIAERAGVSIGSLYRYFDDKEAVVAALCDREVGSALEALEREAEEPLTGADLRSGIEQLIDFQLDRHRRMLALGSSFYRDHHREFSLAQRMGSEAVEEIIDRFLGEHADEVRVDDPREAAFLLGRGVSAIVRQAVEEQPERLERPAFRTELIAMLTAYLCTTR